VAPLKVVRANDAIEFKVNVGTRPKPARSDK